MRASYDVIFVVIIPIKADEVIKSVRVASGTFALIVDCGDFIAIVIVISIIFVVVIF